MVRRVTGVMMCIASVLFAASTGDASEIPSGLIAAEQLKTQMDRQKIKVIGLRGEAEYEAGHIPGAILINNKDFEDPNHPVTTGPVGNIYQVITSPVFDCLLGAEKKLVQEYGCITYWSASMYTQFRYCFSGFT